MTCEGVISSFTNESWRLSKIERGYAKNVVRVSCKMVLTCDHRDYVQGQTLLNWPFMESI